MTDNPMRNSLLLWLDFETTGLDHEQLIPLEVAYTIVLPKPGLPQVYGVRNLLLDADPDAVEEQLSANWKVRKMHAVNGLTEEWHAAKKRWTCEEAAQQMINSLEFVKSDRGLKSKHRVHLAGGGVAGFDFQVMRDHMPGLVEYLHYATLDFSVLRRWTLAMDWPDIRYDIADTDNHRAKGDILAQLELARSTTNHLIEGTVPDGPRQDPAA